MFVREGNVYFSPIFFFFFFSLKIVESDVHVVARVTVLFPLNFYEHLLTIIFSFNCSKFATLLEHTMDLT